MTITITIQFAERLVSLRDLTKETYPNGHKEISVHGVSIAMTSNANYQK
jgi:hypothetical protein